MDSEGRPEVKTPNPRVELPYTTCGLVRHALPLIDDDGVSLRRLRPFYAEAEEFELVTVLYVLYPKNYSQQLKLSA